MKNITTAAILSVSTGCFAFVREHWYIEYEVTKALETIREENLQHTLGVINAFQIYTEDFLKEKLEEIYQKTSSGEFNNFDISQLEAYISNNYSKPEYELYQAYLLLYFNYMLAEDLIKITSLDYSFTQLLNKNEESISLASKELSLELYQTLSQHFN